MSSGSNVAQSRSAMLTSVQQATKNVFKTYVMQQQSNPNFAFTQEPQVISLMYDFFFNSFVVVVFSSSTNEMSDILFISGDCC